MCQFWSQQSLQLWTIKHITFIVWRETVVMSIKTWASAFHINATIQGKRQPEKTQDVVRKGNSIQEHGNWLWEWHTDRETDTQHSVDMQQADCLGTGVETYCVSSRWRSTRTTQFPLFTFWHIYYRSPPTEQNELLPNENNDTFSTLENFSPLIQIFWMPGGK